MAITVRKTFGRLRDVQLLTAQDMRDVGALVRERIVTRTLRGQDAEGQAFAPYSEGYATRKREALGTSRVDLRVSGEMVNAIGVIEATDRKVVVGFRR